MTKLDHDANISPWLELAHDKGITVHLCEFDGEGRLDLDHLRSLVGERTRVVAFPWASNALGTVTPVDGDRRDRPRGRRARLVRRRALRAARADRPRRRSRSTCCSARRTSSTGPHLGVARRAPRAARELAAVQGAARAGRTRSASGFETGTLAHELLCGFIATVEYLQMTSWEFIQRARAHARAALPRRAARRLDAARPADDGGPRLDVRDHARRGVARGRRRAARRGRVRGVARQLLRARGDEAPRPRGRRDPRRHRPLQHRGRGRPAARGASAPSSSRCRATARRRRPELQVPLDRRALGQEAGRAAEALERGRSGSIHGAKASGSNATVTVWSIANGSIPVSSRKRRAHRLPVARRGASRGGRSRTRRAAGRRAARRRGCAPARARASSSPPCSAGRCRGSSSNSASYGHERHAEVERVLDEAPHLGLAEVPRRLRGAARSRFARAANASIEGLHREVARPEPVSDRQQPPADLARCGRSAQPSWASFAITTCERERPISSSSSGVSRFTVGSCRRTIAPWRRRTTRARRSRRSSARSRAPRSSCSSRRAEPSCSSGCRA